MNKIKQHRIGNLIKLLFMLSFVTLGIIFRDNFIESFFNVGTPIGFSIVFLCCLIFGIGIIICFSFIEIIKPEQKIKEEFIESKNNRIRTLEKQILIHKNEIENYG